jgi:cytochrome c oxidase subunit IV
MAETTTNSNWWIWKVFWILLVVTAVEVALGLFAKQIGSDEVEFLKPGFLIYTKLLGTKLLNHIFIVLTLVKAGYIVMSFMHLGHERKSLKWAILLPPLILIPYLLFIVLVEGDYSFMMI